MKHIRLPLAKTLLTLLLTLGALSLAVGAFSWHWRGFTLVEWWRETQSGLVLSQARTRAKVIALTFDDGPDPALTPRVLAILRRYRVHATFFEEGQRVAACPGLARAVVADGHGIGNHTLTHPYLTRRSRAQIQREIEGCDARLADVLRLRTHLFRPPRGQWNPTIFREARHDGDRIILWTVALEHHEARTPRAMALRALRLIQPGGIVLLHDGGPPSREATLKALPLLLDGLRARGYRCVTVPELLHIPGNDRLPARSAADPARA